MLKATILFLLGCAELVFLATSHAAELQTFQETESVTFSGKGTKNTRPFTVKGEWELRWESSDLITAMLHTKDGGLEEIVINAPEGGTGTSYFPNPGIFYFKVNAIKDWTITIVDLLPSDSP